jgi:hypothetical protein
MSHVEAMLDAYPKDLGNVDRGKLAECPALPTTANTPYERPAAAAVLRMIGEADTACWAPSLLLNDLDHVDLHGRLHPHS